MNDTSIVIAVMNQPEAEAVLKFLSGLTQEERKAFLNFIEGVRFSKALSQSA